MYWKKLFCVDVTSVRDTVIAPPLPGLNLMDFKELKDLMLSPHLTGVNLDAKTVDHTIDRYIMRQLCVRPHFSYSSYFLF